MVGKGSKLWTTLYTKKRRCSSLEAWIQILVPWKMLLVPCPESCYWTDAPPLNLNFRVGCKWLTAGPQEMAHLGSYAYLPPLGGPHPMTNVYKSLPALPKMESFLRNTCCFRTCMDQAKVGLNLWHTLAGLFLLPSSLVQFQVSPKISP